MAKRTEEVSKNGTPMAAPFSNMLTLDQVEEVLNLGKPLVYALVRSGELRAAQFGGRGYLARSRWLMPFLPRSLWADGLIPVFGFCAVRRDRWTRLDSGWVGMCCG